MNRDNLRKVKWVAGTEYYYGDKKLTKEQTGMYLYGCEERVLEEIGEENFKLLKSVIVYEYGYFHQWVIENYGNSYEGFSTYVYGLIEEENGKVDKFPYDRFTFID